MAGMFRIWPVAWQILTMPPTQLITVDSFVSRSADLADECSVFSPRDGHESVTSP